MSGTPPHVEVFKGKTGLMVIDTWRGPRGQSLVSVAQMFLDSHTGQYVRKKGRFALTPSEARELGAALLEVAGCVEGLVSE